MVTAGASSFAADFKSLGGILSKPQAFLWSISWIRDLTLLGISLKLNEISCCLLLCIFFTLLWSSYIWKISSRLSSSDWGHAFSISMATVLTQLLTMLLMVEGHLWFYRFVAPWRCFEVPSFYQPKRAWLFSNIALDFLQSFCYYIYPKSNFSYRLFSI